jgi:hypothetical protein
MVTVDGEIVSLAVLLLLRLIVTFEGAAVGRLTGYAADLLSPTLALVGSVRVPAGFTVTVAVVLAMFGVLVLAVMVDEPVPTSVTGTFTLFWLAGIVTVAGTVTAPVLEDVRVKVMLVGAWTDRDSERVGLGLPCVTVSVEGKNEADPLTCTGAFCDP